MTTVEQAQQLIVEGAQALLREYGQSKIEQMTLVEFLVAIESMANRAVRGEGGIVWKDSGDRQMRFLRVAGLVLLALQQHGTELYTTHKLRRSLHPQQAEQKSLLMECQFLRAEAKDDFVACHDAAKLSPFFDEEPWRKLKATLERLGVQF